MLDSIGLVFGRSQYSPLCDRGHLTSGRAVFDRNKIHPDNSQFNALVQKRIVRMAAEKRDARELGNRRVLGAWPPLLSYGVASGEPA
ncbi:MAG TPA: hypothetical protein VN723_14275 [Rhizomicrobium sp.]|jgi:hypothetical protein|nr:hypothetical protein [Rhizomicrobium sp.]